ncbi:MurR/RpiR family transcriptional regulator [Plesiomonas shigelloides]|uniref:MurR/RpiR family transcriptional regulator n=1 Tax=Plesiomonas shigelloides TaxID=703 RepID=UPI00224597E5|nr:MurR/RpiR family transcriptional regulator [Plesiomonas shigelloides]MCX2497419.1 MurR/RpiR family transcriptional regulator [Plesiomonas shigelloides]
MSSAKNFAELQDQIRARYAELSKRLQQVAKYVIDNKNTVAMQTVAVIAKEADVPPSTLIRFANTFGFSGFNEMKQIFRLDLVKETANYTERARLFREMEGASTADQPHDILQEFARANAQALQQLVVHTPAEEMQRAVDLLEQAQTIYVIGLRRSFSAAAYLRYALSHLERRVVLLDGLGGMLAEQLNLMGREDVVLSISFTPYAEETVMVSEKAFQTGARQIVITDSQISPLASLSDVCFVVKEAQVGAFRSQSATLCLLQSLAVGLAFQTSGQDVAASL